MEAKKNQQKEILILSDSGEDVQIQHNVVKLEEEFNNKKKIKKELLDQKVIIDGEDGEEEVVVDEWPDLLRNVKSLQMKQEENKKKTIFRVLDDKSRSRSKSKQKKRKTDWDSDSDGGGKMKMAYFESPPSCARGMKTSMHEPSRPKAMHRSRSNSLEADIKWRKDYEYKKKREVDKKKFIDHYYNPEVRKENMEDEDRPRRGQCYESQMFDQIAAYNQLYYDGFNWVVRDINSQTRDWRTIQIFGLPSDKVQFSEFQLAQFISVFMKENHLNDEGDEFPVRFVQLSRETKSAKIELTSIDEANRLKCIGKIPILDRECRLQKIVEADADIDTFQKQMDTAQRQGVAQARTIQAMNAVQGTIVEQKKEIKEVRKKQKEEERQYQLALKND